MSFGQNKPILETHSSCKFHQLSSTQSWDIAKNLLFECALLLGKLVTMSKNEEFFPIIKQLCFKYMANGNCMKNVLQG